VQNAAAALRTFMGCASSHASLVRVAVLVMNWSRPTSATVLPHGTLSTASCLRPMHSTVRCTDLTYRSFLVPGSKLGPMMRTWRGRGAFTAHHMSTT
jgi:hypothetical protein